MTRSGLSPANSCAMPWSGCPTSASAGSRTSSRKTRNCRSGLTISIGIGWAVSPGASVGTTNSAGRSVPFGRVRQLADDEHARRPGRRR